MAITACEIFKDKGKKIYKEYLYNILLTSRYNIYIINKELKISDLSDSQQRNNKYDTQIIFNISLYNVSIRTSALDA